jgi:Bifunctional DNA primase/polymerase, N-terminal
LSIAVPTGPLSGFDVLDLDPRHGSDNWRAENIHLLPDTRVHGTAGGGEHWLFPHAEGLRNSSGKIAPGLDVRADGGYVIDRSR